MHRRNEIDKFSSLIWHFDSTSNIIFVAFFSLNTITFLYSFAYSSIILIGYEMEAKMNFKV